MRDDSVLSHQPMSAGAVLLSRLGHLGVDAIFANSGTDFPPMIEGMAEASARGLPQPEALIMPHESAAIGMAHGHYLASGRAQAVMVHTNVGLANAAMGLINAACEQVPLLLMGGRTPTLEKGRFGARTVPIGWGQEMLDQHALVREACKWDYEIRFPEQIEEVIDRAYGIAMSHPRGPVYLSLPREVLCEVVETGPAQPPRMQPATPAPAAGDLARAAELLAKAENPVIFAQRGAGDERGFGTLGELAQEWGIPVCQYWAVQLALPTDHPMAAGPDPRPLLDKADVILVIDSLAPWSPAEAEPRRDARIIQLGPDPLHSRFGVRNFRSDISLTGEVSSTILALKAELDARLSGRRARNEGRAAAVAKANAASRAFRLDIARSERAAPLPTKAWISHALSEALADSDAAVFSELGCQLPAMTLGHHKAWFDGPHSGGLGWGLPAAMGFKLSDPKRTVVATMGDGSYIFSNPVACHQIAEARHLSVLVIVLNNAEWGAVRASVEGLYPRGHAAMANSVPLTTLDPSPDFARVAQASRAWARRVETTEGFETALADGLAHVRANRGLALIEVATGRD